MKQDEIIEMAQTLSHGWWLDDENLEAFAKLVEAHTRGQIFKPDWDNYRQGLIDGATAEREACAKVCEDIDFDDWQDRGWDQGTYDCAQAIRARGEA